MPRSLSSQLLIATLAILNLGGAAEDGGDDGQLGEGCSAIMHPVAGRVELRDLEEDGVISRLCGFEVGETVHCYMKANGAVHQYRTITWPQGPEQLVKFSLLPGKLQRDKALTLSVLSVGERSGRNVSLEVTVDARKVVYDSRAAELVHCPRCRFTSDWTSDNTPYWAALLQPWSRSSALGGEIDVLEIGSWEGLSALWWAQNLRARSVTCLDSWEGGAEHKTNTLFHPALSDLEARFDRNIEAGLPASVTLTKRKGLSHRSLAGMINEDPPQLFDLIYVDGEHSAPGVLSDVVLSLRLLAPG
ncbi:hypothetical protein T484DRAFT_1936650, partial [Baffinella frigidus]